LVNHHALDEYWLSGSPGNYDPPNDIALHYYMTKKGRYFAAAFFDILDMFPKLIKQNAVRASMLLARRAATFSSTLVSTRAAYQLVNFSERYQGVCGMPVTGYDVQAFNQAVQHQYADEIRREVKQLESSLKSMAQLQGLMDAEGPDVFGSGSGTAALRLAVQPEDQIAQMISGERESGVVAPWTGEDSGKS